MSWIKSEFAKDSVYKTMVNEYEIRPFVLRDQQGNSRSYHDNSGDEVWTIEAVPENSSEITGFGLYDRSPGTDEWSHVSDHSTFEQAYLAEARLLSGETPECRISKVEIHTLFLDCYSQLRIWPAIELTDQCGETRLYESTGREIVYTENLQDIRSAALEEMIPWSTELEQWIGQIPDLGYLARNAGMVGEILIDSTISFNLPYFQADIPPIKAGFSL